MREYVFQATGVTHELFGEGLEDRVALAYCTSSPSLFSVIDMSSGGNDSAGSPSARARRTRSRPW